MLVKPHDPAFKQAERQDIVCRSFEAALDGCLNLSVFLDTRHHEVASGLNRLEFLTAFLAITQLVADHERSVDRQGFEDGQRMMCWKRRDRRIGEEMVDVRQHA